MQLHFLSYFRSYFAFNLYVLFVTTHKKKKKKKKKKNTNSYLFYFFFFFFAIKLDIPQFSLGYSASCCRKLVQRHYLSCLIVMIYHNCRSTSRPPPPSRVSFSPALSVKLSVEFTTDNINEVNGTKGPVVGLYIIPYHFSARNQLYKKENVELICFRIVKVITRKSRHIE